MFETTNPQEGWDGKVNGKDQPMGTYVYRISLTRLNGKLTERKGTVFLLR